MALNASSGHINSMTPWTVFKKIKLLGSREKYACNGKS